MTNGDAPGSHRIRESGDHDAGRPPGDGEVQDPPAPSGDRVPAANEELLCTICGLRACWQ
jgi:hypothetical protein